MAETDDLRPWDRQPGETSKAYEAFLTYRDLGAGRSIQLVCNELGKSKTVMDRWSSQHNWVSRAAAWDSMPGRKIESAYEEMAKDIAEQHRALSDKLMARLSRNLDLLPEGADPTIRWSTAQAAAHRGHSFATDLAKPKDTQREAIAGTIEKLIRQLAGED